MVDTRQPNRIGKLQECLQNPGIELHLYDHHPDSFGDMKGDKEVVQPYGSTSTVFTRIFIEQNISVTKDEATLLALGIYEDTGSFMHASTVPEDLQAASWLLSQGANLDIITQFVSQDLSATQVGLLGNLLKNATTYTIQNVEVVVTKLTLQDYVDSFAVILHRLMVMENLDVLFGLIVMGERIYLIARSRIPEVNVGQIARDFGGGGHASAASATVKDMTLFEAEDRLVHLLHRYIRPRAIAGEIMSSPVITITPDISINEANDLLTRYNITVLPVISGDINSTDANSPPEILGMISRRVIEKAIFHKLGHLPVSDYMTTEIATLPSTATLADIQEMIIGHRQRLIPIIERGRVQGVITRTDLLNLLVNDPAHLPKNLLHEDEQPSTIRTRNLTTLMASHLNRDVIVLLRLVGEVAEKRKCQVYAVGGFVRDLLLNIKNLDLDFVVEGDGKRA